MKKILLIFHPQMNSKVKTEKFSWEWNDSSLTWFVSTPTHPDLENPPFKKLSQSLHILIQRIHHLRNFYQPQQSFWYLNLLFFFSYPLVKHLKLDIVMLLLTSHKFLFCILSYCCGLILKYYSVSFLEMWNLTFFKCYHIAKLFSLSFPFRRMNFLINLNEC